MMDILNGLGDFFSMLGDMIFTGVEFLVMMVKGLLTIVGILPRAVSFMTMSVGYMPEFVVPFILAIIMTLWFMVLIKIVKLFI